MLHDEIVTKVPPTSPYDCESSVSSIGKALRVLRALAGATRGEAGVSEVASLSGLAKSTAHRVLTELAREDFVCKASNRYRLGPEWFVMQTALRFSEYSQISGTAYRHLASLFEATKATVHLGVLRGDRVLYLEKLTAPGGTLVPTRVGGSMPATCTALGKALLAFGDGAVVDEILSTGLPVLSGRSIAVPSLLLAQLRDVQTTGLAYDHGESNQAVSCVAAPVFRDDKVVAAVSVCRITQEQLPPADRVYLQRATIAVGRALSGIR